MKHTLRNQAKWAGIALAAVAAFSALGTGTAQAASFASAAVTLDRFGNLECTLRETGLPPGGTVRYDCTATDVGALTQCYLRNKAVGNSKLMVFHDVSAHEIHNYEVKSNGAIRAAIITQIPTSEANALLCTAPAELKVSAVRWCNASIVDLTNNITGASEPALFVQLIANAPGSVPLCATLATLPGLPPGE